MLIPTRLPRRLSLKCVLLISISLIAFLCIVHNYPLKKEHNDYYITIPKFTLVEDNRFNRENRIVRNANSVIPDCSNKRSTKLQKNESSLPSILVDLPHLAAFADELQPFIEYPNDTVRKGVEIVIGIPTVSRKQVGFALKVECSFFPVSYLSRTLQSLLFSITKEQSDKVLIVLMIASKDGNSEEVEKQLSSLANAFGEYFNSGLLHVIVPPTVWYPNDLDHIESTLGDSPERMYWRTKQNLDYLYLMLYCELLGDYYLQIEDDVITRSGFVSLIKEKIESQKSRSWFLMEFSSLGFIGKLFHSKDLRYLMQFIALLYRYKPVDWILDSIFYDRYCTPFSAPKICAKAFKQYRLRGPTLFQHVGLKSSLDGKVQVLKEKSFKEVMSFNPHTDNPVASLSSNLPHYLDYSFQKLYDGLSAFWSSQPPVEDDYLSIQFSRPVLVKGLLVRSGNAEHPDDVFDNNTVVRYKYSNSNDFGPPVPFDENGIARISFDKPLALSLVEIEVSSNHTHWVVLSELSIRV